jgi:hypothetical protein
MHVKLSPVLKLSLIKPLRSRVVGQAGVGSGTARQIVHWEM